MSEFCERMKTATQRRRLGNTRVRARADLPKPAQRIQPKVETTTQFKTVWVANFAGRTGWHGINTTTDKMMFFLVCHHGKTFFIDLEPYRVTGDDVSYAFTQDFDLVRQLKPLSSLDAAITDDVVMGRAFRFEVGTTPTTGGLLIKPIKSCRITGPLPKAKRGAKEEEDEEDEDCLEDEAVKGVCVIESDVEIHP